MTEKRSESLGNTMSYIRTRYIFSLLRTTLLCIRGTRKGKKKALPINEVDFAGAKEEAILLK